jgi:hypothetical protein
VPTIIIGDDFPIIVGVIELLFLDAWKGGLVVFFHTGVIEGFVHSGTVYNTSQISGHIVVP